MSDKSAIVRDLILEITGKALQLRWAVEKHESFAGVTYTWWVSVDGEGGRRRDYMSRGSDAFVDETEAIISALNFVAIYVGVRKSMGSANPSETTPACV
jgi:hypothetical protein